MPFVPFRNMVTFNVTSTLLRTLSCHETSARIRSNLSSRCVFAATSRLIALDGCSFSDLPIEHMCDESIYTHKLGLDSLIQHIMLFMQ